MTFVEVDRIPDNTTINRKGKKDLKTFLIDFISSDIKYAELIFTEDDYKTSLNARNSLVQSIRDNDYPVWVYLRGDKVYLENMN